MEAPATRESKPGSAARDAGDGQARNARSVTGPLAGAVLGPTVCGGCERGRWHRTTPTTGLFQRDGGWFGLGGGVFVAEEGLIEGVDAVREPSIQAVDAGVKRRDIGAYLLAELGQVRADGFKSVRPPRRSPARAAELQHVELPSDDFKEPVLRYPRFGSVQRIPLRLRGGWLCVGSGRQWSISRSVLRAVRPADGIGIQSEGIARVEVPARANLGGSD